MNLAALLGALGPHPVDTLPFPRNLLGLFRRKTISFCTGMTDETTVVYWAQSRSFSIDLRLPDAAATAATDRQGWIGDTLWDDASSQLSWQIERSYQPRNQWPEPAGLSIIGNCVLEFAPSGAYVEDWRQQSARGPLLGLRLNALRNENTGREAAMDGGLIVAGDHFVYARSRLPEVDAALKTAPGLEAALTAGIATAAQIESYEVSVAIGSPAITYSTQPQRIGAAIGAGPFRILPDGKVEEQATIDGEPCTLTYTVDVYEPEFTFDMQTPATPASRDWMEMEKGHLARHAVPVG